MKLLFGTLFLFLLSVSTGVDPYLPAFHFTPTPQNWMSDPNGPFYDPKNDKYHLMFQYNSPRVWGHAVSTDMLSNWINLPVAISNNESYNNGGVFTGSTTVLSLNDIKILYSVSSLNYICLAYPSNNSDPLLVEWSNYDENCVINSSNGDPTGDDASTAWFDNTTNLWTFIYAKQDPSHPTNHSAITYSSLSSNNFTKWFRQNNLYYDSQCNSFECIDFYKLPNSPNNNYIFKASCNGKEQWISGEYNSNKIEFKPYLTNDCGNNINCSTQVFDYSGIYLYYASKSFYDSKNNRQILWGWISEERNVGNNGEPFGWAGLQSLPRVVQLYNPNNNTKNTRIITSMLPEFDDIMHIKSSYYHNNLVFKPGIYKVIMFDKNDIYGNQLDIKANLSSNAFECIFYVLSDESAQLEYTRIGFIFSQREFYVDTSMSTLNPNISGWLQPGTIPEYNGIDILNIRIIIDHSVIEVFVNNGVSVLTRRAYPLLSTSKYVGILNNDQNNNLYVNISSWNVKNANFSLYKK